MRLPPTPNVPARQLYCISMDFAYKTCFKIACNTGYETLIYDCMIGDATLFQRADTVEAGWQVVQPISVTTPSPELLWLVEKPRTKSSKSLIVTVVRLLSVSASWRKSIEAAGVTNTADTHGCCSAQKSKSQVR